jgi:hypothetical protein
MYFVTKDTFPSLLTYRRFVDHIRNALSDPTTSEKAPFLPSTGYTTVPDATWLISRYRFIESPWVSRGKRLSQYFSPNVAKVQAAPARSNSSMAV